VIRGDDDEGVVPQPGSIEGVEQSADVVIGVRDLGTVLRVQRTRDLESVGSARPDPLREAAFGVGFGKTEERARRANRIVETFEQFLEFRITLAIHPAPRLRRIVRRVRVEVVDEQEQRPGLAAAGSHQPVDHGIGNLGRPALVTAGARINDRGVAVIVVLEPLLDVDRGSHLGQHQIGVGDEVTVACDAVGVGVGPGQHRSVRRQCRRRRADVLLEEDPVPGQRVEMGRFDESVTVAAEVIGAQGIDRDQHNVPDAEPSGRRRRPVAARAGEHGTGKHECQSRPADATGRGGRGAHRFVSTKGCPAS